MKKVKMTISSLALLTLGFALSGCQPGSSSSLLPSSLSSSSTSSSQVAVDREALRRRLEFVEDNFLDQASLYTEESYQALLQAYQTAKNVYELEDVTQAEVDQALQQLNAAIEALDPLVQPSSGIDEILDYVDSAAGNYTIAFEDYMGETPSRYTYYLDGEGFYDEERNFGITQFGNYMHAYSIEGDEVKMDRAVLAERLLPSYLLTPERLTSVIQVIGKSEQFSGFGLDIYGFFATVPNESYYVLDNVNYYEWFLGLTYGRYTISSDEAAGLFSKATLELQGDSLVGQLFDNDDRLAFRFTVSDAAETTIAALEQYKAGHSEYVANPDYDPSSRLLALQETFADGNYGIEMDLYSNREGRSDQEPDLTVTHRYNPSGSTYLVNSLGKGLLLTDQGTRAVTLEGDGYVLGAESEKDLSKVDLFSTLLSDPLGLVLRKDTDEYFLDLDGEDALKEALSTVFFIEDYLSWASEGKYGGTPTYSTSFDAVSISVNAENFLTLTLWNGDKMIARGVLRQENDVVLPIFEEEQSSLEALYRSVEDVTNSDRRFTEESYAQFDVVREAARNYLETTEGGKEEDYCVPLDNAFQGLEPVGFQADEAMEDKVTTYVQETIYTDEYSSTSNAYRMNVFKDGKTDSYVITSKYVLNETTGEGMLVTDSAVYEFILSEGQVHLTAPVLHESGYQYNYLSRAFDYLQNISIIGIEPTFLRMNNSSAVYTDEEGFVQFVPGVEGVTGVSLFLEGDVLKGNAYATLDVTLPETPSLSLHEINYLKRKEVASFEITTENATNEILEQTLSSSAIVEKEAILEKTSSLPDVLAIDERISGRRTIVSSTFSYDVTSGIVTAENSTGQVAQFTLESDASTGMPFTILHNPLLDEGEPVMGLETIAGDLFDLRNVTEADLSLVGSGRLNYALSEGWEGVTQALGLSQGADLRLSVIDGNLVLSHYSTSRVDGYFEVTGSLTSQEESDVTMIGNIVAYFL